jgi:integrase
LKARSSAYYASIDRNIDLGYLKGKHDGSWILRYYRGDGKYGFKRFATADDRSEADGESVLDFWQAQHRAREFYGKIAGLSGRAPRGNFTVADAMADYLEWQEAHRKDYYNARNRAENHILPALGKIKVTELTTRQIEKWLRDLASTPPRLRHAADGTIQFRDHGTDPEAERKRKVTANKCLTLLKAALNRAKKVRDDIPSDDAWRNAESFAKVDAARIRWLTVEECRRLINAADPDMRELIRGALATGARFGELTRLNCLDFDPDRGTVHVHTSKAGPGRYIDLNEEGIALFKHLTAGRPGDAPIFLKAEGSRWGKSHQGRPFAAAVKKAKIFPPVSFHGLRHSYASLALMNGMALIVLAHNLGHSDTRMVEKHYGHLSKKYKREMIRATAPTFGLEESNVQRIRK